MVTVFNVAGTPERHRGTVSYVTPRYTFNPVTTQFSGMYDLHTRAMHANTSTHTNKSMFSRRHSNDEHKKHPSRKTLEQHEQEAVVPIIERLLSCRSIRPSIIDRIPFEDHLRLCTEYGRLCRHDGSVRGQTQCQQR